MKRALFIIVLGIAVALAAGLVTYAVMHHGAATASAGQDTHHGMSPAVWVAIFTGVWVPLLAGASRRRRDKRDGGDKQP